MNHTRTLVRLLTLAVVLGGGVLSDVHAQRLGRLFTSTGERATLDEMRLQAGIVRPAPEPPEAEPEPQPPVQVSAPSGPSISRLVINGVVRRSRGPSTVWVNGDLIERGGMSKEGIAVESTRGASGSVRLRLPSGAGTVALRPGQQIDIDSGMLLEAYEKQSTRAVGSAFQPHAPLQMRGTDVPGEDVRGNPSEPPKLSTSSNSGTQSSSSADQRSGLAARLRVIADLPPTEQAKALERMQTESKGAPVLAPSR